MSDPTKYTPSYDFSDFEADNPTSPKPGAELDIEFANIAEAVGTTVEAIQDIRRSDGALKNGIVTLDSLDTTVAGLLGQNEYLQIVSDNISQIVTVSDDLSGVDTIGTVATDLTGDNKIGQVVANLGPINIVSADLAGANTIGTVAGEIANVVTVGENIEDVNRYANTYLPPSSTPPTTRVDGSPLQAGDLWYDTSINEMKKYDGAAFTLVTTSSLGGLATGAGTFGPAPSGRIEVGSFTVLFVWVNGFLLKEGAGADYTQDGTGFDILSPMEGDEWAYWAYQANDATDYYTKVEADVKFGDGTVTLARTDGSFGRADFDTKSQIESWSAPEYANSIITRGYALTGDGGAALYVRSVGPVPDFIGNNLFVDAGFDTPSRWTMGSAWSISGGQAIANGVATSRIEQFINLVSGLEYEVTFTVSNYVSGRVRWVALNAENLTVNGTVGAQDKTANGTYTDRFVAGSGIVKFGFRGGEETNYRLDNVSIRPVVKFQRSTVVSADGSTWSLSGDEIWLEALGAFGDDATDCTLAIQEALALQQVTGKIIRAGAGVFRSGQVHALGQAYIRGTGVSQRGNGAGNGSNADVSSGTNFRFVSAVRGSSWMNWFGLVASYDRFEDFKVVGAGRQTDNDQGAFRFAPYVGINRSVIFDNVALQEFNGFAIDIPTSIGFQYLGGYIRSCGPRGVKGGGIRFWSDGSLSSASLAGVSIVITAQDIMQCNYGVYVAEGELITIVTFDDVIFQYNSYGIYAPTSGRIRMNNCYLENNDNDGAVLLNGWEYACRKHASGGAIVWMDRAFYRLPDGDQEMLVGRASASFAGNSNVSGVTITPDGGIALERTSAPIQVNRIGSNGEVVNFRRQGPLVGSITVGASSTSFNTTSDERLKSNFHETLEPGSLIDDLASVMATYVWNLDGSIGYGVSAQRAHSIIPEMVSVGSGELGEDDFIPWSVDWSKVVPYLVAYCKKLEIRISELERS